MSFDGAGSVGIRPKLAEVIRVVAQAHGITAEEIKGQSRKRQFARPRQVAAYLCREMTLHSYPEIGRSLGGRDHTTVLFAFRKMAARRTHSPELEAELSDYRERIMALAVARWEIERQQYVPPPAAPKEIKPRERGFDHRWWTTDQLRTLREMRADGAVYASIAERLGRTVSAVDGMAAKLGIRSPEAARASL